MGIGSKKREFLQDEFLAVNINFLSICDYIFMITTKIYQQVLNQNWAPKNYQLLYHILSFLGHSKHVKNWGGGKIICHRVTSR
jgi:hypothetical protein